MTPRTPQWVKDLASCGMPYEEYVTLRGKLAEFGICAAHVPRKGWRLFCVGREGFPTMIFCWCGIGAMIDFLRNTETTIAAVYEKGGDTKRRTQ